jgi:hypothetical protein
MNLQLKVKEGKSEKIGTLNHTINLLSNSKIEIRTLKNGCMAIIDVSDGDATIIARECRTFSYKFRGCNHYQENGKFTFSKDKSLFSIEYCFPEEDQIWVEDGEIWVESLFGKVLTPASRNLVEKFISECENVLVSAIVARNAQESEMLKTLVVNVKITSSNDENVEQN